MEPINKAELEQLKFKAKKSLRNGDITLYDALELMAKTIDDTVDYMNETSATLVKNENERIENENTRIEAMVDADGLAAALYYTVKKIERDDEDFTNHPALWRFYNKAGAEVEGRKLELPVCGSTPEGEVVGLLTVADYAEFKTEHVATINILQEGGKLVMKTYNYDDGFIDDEEFPTATASSDGAMSAADKTKLDALPTGASITSSLAQKASTSSAVGSVSVTPMEDCTGLEVESVGGSHLASLFIPAATTSDAGVMLPDEKAKLYALPTNASLTSQLNNKASKDLVDTLDKTSRINALFTTGFDVTVSTPYAVGYPDASHNPYAPIVCLYASGALTRKIKLVSNGSNTIRVWVASETLLGDGESSNWADVKSKIYEYYSRSQSYDYGALIEVTMTGSAGKYKGEADFGASIPYGTINPGEKYAILVEVVDNGGTSPNVHGTFVNVFE